MTEQTKQWLKLCTVFTCGIIIGIVLCLQVHTVTLEIYKATKIGDKTLLQFGPSLTEQVKTGDIIYFGDIAIKVK